MHSSRMRTGRSLTVSRSLLPGGGGLVPGGSAPGGCLLPGGVCSGGWGSAPGGSAPGGGMVSQHVLRQTPPP